MVVVYVLMVRYAFVLAAKCPTGIAMVSVSLVYAGLKVCKNRSGGSLTSFVDTRFQ